jgi:hypothetical protein
VVKPHFLLGLFFAGCYSCFLRVATATAARRFTHDFTMRCARALPGNAAHSPHQSKFNPKKKMLCKKRLA